MKNQTKISRRLVGTFLLTSAIFLSLGMKAPKTAPAPTGPFLIKPYVFTIKGSKIAVAWSYNAVPTDVQLQLTRGDDVEEITPVQDRDLYVAELPIAMCDFGSDVSYQVTGQAAAITIANIPCPGHSKGLTRFVFLADTQEGTEYAGQFAKLAAAFKGSAVLLGGDLVQDGSKMDQWIKLFDAMSPVLNQQVLVPVVGNHEYRFDKDVPLWKYFFRTAASDAHYAMDIGDVHVIGLNSCFSDDPSQEITQTSWLETELAKPAKWRIVFFHHPPYSKGIMNNPDYVKKEFLSIQKNYVPLFEKYKVDVVLNGHTHLFERSIKNGVNYVVTGPGGGKMGVYGGINQFSVMTDRVRTMIQLEVSPSVLRVTTVTLEGKTLDQFVLNKN